MNLDRAVVLITGASSGIGAATARAAGHAGARLVLLARREDRLRQLAAELPDAVAVPCDVTDPAQVARATRTALDAFGRIDVVVNNAGQGIEIAVDRVDPDDFRALLELNLLAPLIVLQAVVPVMRDQGAGTIVNVSSGATFGAFPGTGPYSATKAALSQLGAVARAELTGAGVTVSTVYPSLTRTDFFTALRGPAQTAEDDLVDAQTPEQVADVILGLVRSGEAEADLVPVELGGTFTG